jgi:hypothetical protein
MISRARQATLVLTTLILLAGCGRQTPTRGSADASGVEAASSTSPRSAASNRSSEQRRAELLNRIRAADPQQATIVRALLNENNELGLVLSRQANLDDVPKLLRTMLAELDKSFPGQNHTAIAYTPTNPPQTIGTARLDARTRDMTYTPAR